MARNKHLYSRELTASPLKTLTAPREYSLPAPPLLCLPPAAPYNATGPLVFPSCSVVRGGICQRQHKEPAKRLSNEDMAIAKVSPINLSQWKVLILVSAIWSVSPGTCAASDDYWRGGGGWKRKVKNIHRLLWGVRKQYSEDLLFFSSLMNLNIPRNDWWLVHIMQDNIITQWLLKGPFMLLLFHIVIIDVVTFSAVAEHTTGVTGLV